MISIIAYAADLVKHRGFNAIPKLRKNVKIDEKTQNTILPHKTVATRAGLGWIGKSALLVTEEYGSALRISSVLTDAELETGTPIDASKCGECRICQKSCPAGAVKGSNWSIDVERDRFYDPFACRRTARERSGKIGIDETLCGLCILVCPWTKKYLQKAGENPPGRD